MFSRRDFLRVAAATAAMGFGPGQLGRAAAAQSMTRDDLLRFDAVGQVTLLHFTDMHAQIVPLYFREPSVNLGVGEVHGLVPHITGSDLMVRYGLKPGSAAAHTLTYVDFVEMARHYGKVGGLDRMATLVNAVRAERPNNTLLLDGGDTWQGSYTSLKTKGEDMVKAMNALGVDAMTAHWEFTYGAERVGELVEMMDFPFLCGNVTDTEWEEPVFDAYRIFERGGVAVGVVGQAFPYTPIANPRYMIPNWSFGIEEKTVQANVNAVREEGADIVVLLSHNGFDVDRKLASRVEGIDVILTGHTHDALPDVVKIGNTLLVASGSHGKFLSRLDLKVDGGKVSDFRFKLMPVLADAIEPDPRMARVVADIRAPFASEIDRVVGRTDSLLYRRGNFNGSFDDLICDALRQERDAQIALSPGFRWGGTLLPGQDITIDHIYHHTAITYPNAYRTDMTGRFIHEILEDVADNLFNPDPYYQQGGDMVRVGGMAYTIDIGKPIGGRVTDMTLVDTGEKIDPAKTYTVTGWASVNEGVEGPPVYDLVTSYIEDRKVIEVPENRNIRVIGA